MDANLLNAVATLIQDYGLPLIILFAFVYLILTRRLVVGSEVAYREELRDEEHQARKEAEDRLDKALSVMSEHTELLQEIEREVLRGQGVRSGA